MPEFSHGKGSQRNALELWKAIGFLYKVLFLFGILSRSIEFKVEGLG